MGLSGSRSRRRKPPRCSARRNCAAWPGVVAGEGEGALGVGAPEGATVVGLGSLIGLEK